MPTDAAQSRPPIVWGDAARALFALDVPTAVRAGAGAGKTTALVELTVRLLAGEAMAEPCEPAELAVVTFTEKAAAELEERLGAAIGERLEQARSSGRGAEAAAWTERHAALDRMVIGTIHGFCGTLLREHAVEAGVDPEFEVADEERSADWLREAATGALLDALDRGDGPIAALCAGMGLAGGRGAMVDAVIGLVKERAWRGDERPPEPAPDRAEEAADARGALVACARALLAARGEVGGPSGLRAMEAFAAAFAALDAAALEGAIDPAAAARLAAIADALKGWRKAKADGERPLTLREELKELARRLPPLAAEAAAGPQKRALSALVAEVERRYRERKRAERAVDFDDLLVLARDLVAGDPPLRAELRSRFRVLLVDEYQDVNPVQQELFQLLAGPGEPAGPLLVAVGDLKQSIYRFRGADVAVFAGLVASFEEGRGRVLSLAENHRSVPALLRLANAVSARALQPAAEPARPYEIRFAEGDALVGRRAEGLSPACELLVDLAEGGGPERRRREAAAVAARIEAIVSGRAGVVVRERGVDGVERPRAPRHGDVAILFRRLTQVAVYERALREAGIPCRLARGGGLYHAPEVRDLGELLASLAEPSDALAWAALLRSPLCAISDGALLRLSRLGLGSLPRRPEAALRDAVPGEEGERLLRFLGTWRELRALRDRLGVAELLRRAVEALDVDAALLASPDGERRLRNVERALSLADRFGRAGGSAAELAAHLRRQARRPAREPEADLDPGDAVALLTVHQAKGLEWPIVFVPDLGARRRTDARRAAIAPDGSLTVSRFDDEREEWCPPASLLAAREEEQRAGTAESRRLLYVALTRARDYLVLSGDGERAGEGTWRGLIDAALEAEPSLARAVPYGDAATAAVAPPLGAAAPPPAARPAPEVPPAPLRVPPAPLRMPVTELVEYARCPRRHLLGRTLGLPEPRAESGAPPDDDPARATARGTLAHAMLAESDLGAPPLERRAQLEAAAARRGYDPRSPAVRRILGEVTRFAESPAGRALAAAGGAGVLQREVPFLLRLDGEGGGACYLAGAIDALVADARARVVTVVDYKYAVPRPGAVERYRIQLLAYALAAGRAYPGFTVRTRLQFLRGDARAVDVTPTGEELRRFEAEAPALAAEAARGGGDRSPAALGRTEDRCRREGCGWVVRCHRLASPGLRLRDSGSIP